MSIRYEIRHLRHFIAVAEELNFSLAADKLNLAQPALSRSIKQLEDLLGLQLLIRTSRHVKITGEGQVFLQGAYQALELLEQTNKRAHMVAKGKTGHLRIGYTNFAIVGLLPAILNAFRNAYPTIKLDIVHNFTAKQIEGIKEKKLDFGFVTGPVREEGTQFMTVQENRVVAIVSSLHPLAACSSIQFKQLMHEPFIMGHVKDWSYFQAHVQTIFLKHGFQPNIVQESYDSEGIFGFVEANMGVSLHIEAVRHHHRRGTVVLNLEDVDGLIPTDMVWLSKDQTPVQRQFIEFVSAYLKDNNEITR